MKLVDGATYAIAWGHWWRVAFHGTAPNQYHLLYRELDKMSPETYRAIQALKIAKRMPTHRAAIQRILELHLAEDAGEADELIREGEYLEATDQR